MLSRFFIQRPIFSSVISIFITLAGLITYSFLPVAQYPEMTPPTVTVEANYPGADAITVADTVASLIETEVNGVEDMLYMSSKSSSDGKMVLTVTFEVGTDLDMAQVLVQNRVSIALPRLPEEVRRRGVTTKKRSPNLTLVINLISTDTGTNAFDEIALSNFAKLNIQDELKRIQGVGDVMIMGAKDYSMRIWIDPLKLAKYELSPSDVISAVQKQNVQIAAGRLGQTPTPKGQKFQYTLTAQGRFEEPKQFEKIIIKTVDSGSGQTQNVYLKDVAEVELGAETYDWEARLNGKPSIALGIYQLPGANALEMARLVSQKMGVDQKTGAKLSLKEAPDAVRIPNGMDARIVYDTTRFVEASIDEVFETLIIAFILVFLSVYLFLQDFRSTLIPGVAIPVSLLGTLAVMLAMGFSINTITLFGLILVIGIVVDDAIVVVENVTRLIEDEGLSSKAAAIKAMEEITGPVIATTLVLLAVFVPTAFLPGISGQIYRQFGLTIAVATMFSTVNALTMSPMLCALLLRSKKDAEEAKKNAPMWMAPLHIAYDVTIGLFFKGFNVVFDVVSGGYNTIVKVTCRRVVIMFVLFLGIVGGTVMGLLRMPTGFMPNEDQGYLMVNVELPPAASLPRTAEVMKKVEAVIDKYKKDGGVQDYLSFSGYSLIDSSLGSNTGGIIVTLKPWGERPTAELEAMGILRSLNQDFSKIPDAIVTVFPPPAIQGLGAVGGFELQVQDIGNAGLEELQKVANTVVEGGNTRTNGVVFNASTRMRADIPMYFIDIDRIKAEKMNCDPEAIFSTLQTNLGSAYINDFTRNKRSFRVTMQAKQEFRKEKEDVYNLWVRNRNGENIPLRSLIELEERLGPQVVSRYNLYPAALVNGDSGPGYSSGQAITAMEQVCSQELPAGFKPQWSGITFQQLAAGNLAPFIFALAIVFVFLFLAAQYESWILPMAIILSVPLGILGAVVGLALRGMDVNIYTQIGLVLLIALASKNAILIVEFAQQNKVTGMSTYESAVEACRLRFRPILMTAFSSILGFLPLVIASGAGAESRKSLGTGVFGGMLAATIFGLFFVPIMYITMRKIGDGLYSLFGGKSDTDGVPALAGDEVPALDGDIVLGELDTSPSHEEP